jgi:hypothetical protein
MPLNPSAAASDRRRQPNRRPSTNFSFELGGQNYHATVSYFPDGALAELFLSAEKRDSASDVAARDCAVAISIGLQFGVPLDVIRRALMRDARGGPSGPAAFVLDRVAEEMPGGAE